MTDQPQLPPERHLIDESLELEHALEASSLPATPAYDQVHHRQKSDTVAGLHFDPGVLAHIITQLRQQVIELTAERDALQRPSRESEYFETLQEMSAKVTRLEEELAISKKQNEDDATAISLLRTKVEESRRGLMRLQSESRRQSQQPHPPSALDLSRSSAFSFGGTPTSAKRASFTPLTGSSVGHRRVASVDVSPKGPTFDIHAASPNGHTTSFPDQHPNTGSRRLSALFQARRSVSPEGSPEVESLRRELKNLKDALEETRADLSEAVEAKEASDACAKALRLYIEENQVGVNAPAPVPQIESKVPSSSGWTIGNLFRQPSVSLDMSSVSSSADSSAPNTATATPQAPPLSKKIGSFFASRSNSISSSSSVPAPASLTSHSSRPSVDKRESTYSHSTSDASSVSVAEPISPLEEEVDVGVKIRESTDDGVGRPLEQKVSEASPQPSHISKPAHAIAS